MGRGLVACRLVGEDLRAASISSRFGRGRGERKLRGFGSEDLSAARDELGKEEGGESRAFIVCQRFGSRVLL